MCCNVPNLCGTISREGNSPVPYMYIYIFIGIDWANKYPQFIMGVLAQAKNGDEQFWNIKISCSHWEGSACTQSALILFFKASGWGEDFFSFSLCSQHVPFKLPMGSYQVPNMFPRFPIAPRFNPICFAQSPPILTYIGGPKGEALHLSIESSILGSLHSFNSFLWWANQIDSLQKTKVGLVRHPQLIDIKQNKESSFYHATSIGARSSKPLIGFIPNIPQSGDESVQRKEKEEDCVSDLNWFFNEFHP